MNTELIKKYKAEFDHFLNGGELLIRYCDYENREYKEWKEVGRNYNWNDGRLYKAPQFIINDNFSELRKALCDGKTVQAYYKFNDTWNDIIKPEFKDNVSNYRIKPEEPKFKTGDFVKTPTSIAIVIENNGQLFASNNYELQDCTKWTPSHKELCYFTHDTNTKTSATLREFREISEDGFYVDCFGTRFIYCEPFLNSKPSWFKD